MQKVLSDLIRDEVFLQDVACANWEELVDIAGDLLVQDGAVEPQFLTSIKETVEEFGAYMVLIDDIALFHGRPEAGVHRLAMSLALLREPVYLKEKRIKAAFVFAAPDKDGHIELLRELAELLQDEDFLELLRSHGSKEQIFSKLREVSTGI